MKKVLLETGVIALGAFFSFGYLLYKVGRKWQPCTVADVTQEIIKTRG